MTRGTTPLHVAARTNENPAVIAALIKLGTNPNVQDEFAGTPLHGAATNKNLSVLETLIAAGADPMARDVNGDTPLHVAALYNKKSRRCCGFN